MRSCLYAIFLSLVSFILHGQEQPVKTDYISIAYFGEKVFHPGIQVSVYKYIQLSHLEKKTIHNLQYGIATAGYIHDRNHLGFHLKPQIGYHLTFYKGFEIGFLAETGYMRRFYHGEVFEVKNRTVRKKRLAGQNAFLFGGYLHFAYNPGLRKKKRMKWFLQIGAFWETPFNEGLLIHPTVCIGISKKIFK